MTPADSVARAVNPCYCFVVVVRVTRLGGTRHLVITNPLPSHAYRSRRGEICAGVRCGSVIELFLKQDSRPWLRDGSGLVVAHT